MSDEENQRTQEASEGDERREDGPPIVEHGLRDLPVLDDDPYLRMQALNLGIVDRFLRNEERSLLRRYIAEERTLGPQTVFLSALSQLWIFGLYELLRTWRQRSREVLRFAVDLDGLKATERAAMIEEWRERLRGSSAWPDEWGDGFYWRAFERATEEAGYVDEVRLALDTSESLYRLLEALRVHLAKHEMPGAKGSFAAAPGYGRISMDMGSIYWQVSLTDVEVDVISRVELADACAHLGDYPSEWILPPHLQEMVKPIPRSTWALKQVRVRLHDGTVHDCVVAWNREIVDVGEAERVDFGVGDIAAIDPP